MHIKNIFTSGKTILSYEFFPVKKESAWEGLFDTIKSLVPLKPGYVSVTYGAGGSTRENTHHLLERLTSETELNIIAHLTCVGHTCREIEAIVDRYVEAGVTNIMALRGDLPKDGNNKKCFDHAAQMVAFIKDKYPEIGIGVAGFPEGHPETPNRLLEMDYLKAKVDAGADYICTQLFFNNQDFFDFRDRCRLKGITVPIVAGIMPITTIKGMKKMAELALGARFPAKLLRALARADGDEMVEEVGVHWATEQVRELIDSGVDGIHFYTLNRSNATLKIYRSLGLKSSDSLEAPLGSPF